MYQMASFGPLQSSGGVASSNFDFTHLSIHATEGEEDFERRSMEIDVDTRLVGVADFKQPDTPIKRKPVPRKLKRKKKIIKEKRFLNANAENQDVGWEGEQDFHCLRCQKDVRFSQNFVSNHLKRHRLDLQVGLFQL